ncbi:hypothetical protein ABV531_004961 [Serratia marcescens]|uniref:hypothetical protein n=1 Tax=Serratia marcescens TaxID=615 RepID=UPI002FE67226
MKEIVDDTIEGVKGRLSGLYGYIATSLFLFNWSNIYFLFFSQKTAEQKINSLYISFDIWVNLVIPILFGFTMCALAPRINVLMKSIHKKATLDDKKIQFDNDNYIPRLQLDEELRIDEKKAERDSLVLEIESLKETLTIATEHMESAIKAKDEVDAQKVSLMLEISKKQDELSSIDIELTALKTDYGSYQKLKDSYLNASNALMSSNLKRDEQVDILLGIIKAIIDNGYVTQEVEDLINKRIEDTGYQIPTENPLRMVPRKYQDAKSFDEAVLIGRDPEKTTLPPNPLMFDKN